MLETILDLEKKLIRVETWLLVACVITMLLLAGYNVAYRNLLVPWQTQLLTSGPPVTSEDSKAGADEAGEPSGDGDAEAQSGDETDDDFAGGFGAPSEEPVEKEEGGFEGGFGAEPAEEEPVADEEGAESDESVDDGFAGGFGAPSEDEDAADDAEIGGGFGAAEEPVSQDEEAREELDASAVAEEAVEDEEEAVGGPPPEGSFADTMVGVIDAIKIAWVDILLRQLVIITGFLGAMLATRRRNHITIDAVGKLIEGRPRHIVDAVTSLVSTGVCVVLAIAGWDLVKIGLQYPSELLPWAEEWTFQMAFPVGFGLLALHFAIRVYESVVYAMRDEELDEGDQGDGEGSEPTTSEAAAGGAA